VNDFITNLKAHPTPLSQDKNEDLQDSATRSTSLEILLD